MFSKIFSKNQKTKSDTRRETGKQQQQQQQTSSSSSLETSPHHIYHPLQLRQQYPQLYPTFNQVVEQRKQLITTTTAAATTTTTSATTTTSLESLFHPSKLVTNLSESPGRSRKLRRQHQQQHQQQQQQLDNNVDGEVAEENNLQNESAEQQQQQHHHQYHHHHHQQQQQQHADDDLASTNDVTASRTNMTYDRCHGNEQQQLQLQQSSISNSSNNINNTSSFNVTVQQCLTNNSPAYNFPATYNDTNNDTLTQLSATLTSNSLQLEKFITKSPTNFRNCSQQDLQHFDLLQQQQQQQLQQQQLDKEAKFYPVRYRSLSAGDHTTFAIDHGKSNNSNNYGNNNSNRCSRWGSESEDRWWSGRGERLRSAFGGGLMWGTSRKHISTTSTTTTTTTTTTTANNNNNNQTLTPKSISSEQFYRSIIGQVFLICGKEMKRCVLLQKIGSIDAVRQIFSQAFSDVIKIQEFYGQDPLLTIYILDTVAAVFYELEDYREVRNLSVLKIFEKRPRNETQEKNKSPKKKANKMAADDIQAGNEGQELINHLGSVQSLPPPSPRPEIDVMKMKSREVCCFGGVVGGYQKLPKTVLGSSKQSSLGTGETANPQNSPPVDSNTASGSASAQTAKSTSESKQYHSLDRYHSSGCHHNHHHHHHHRSHKKTKVGTQSASASPSSDHYGQYSLYGSHCSCCRHHCSCDTHLQRCRYQHQQQLTTQSPAKQPKSPVKASHQRHTWTGHQTFCHTPFRPQTDPKGAGSSGCLLPVDLLNTATCSHLPSDGASSSDRQAMIPATMSEMETRMRISQLEDQLASLTQWVQNSIEADTSSVTRRVYTEGSAGHSALPSGLKIEKSQTLHAIQSRLSAMLKDVSHLKDQCQHLKIAHQVQRQEVHEALAFFSQKIISCIRGGIISEDMLVTSLAQNIATFEFSKSSGLDSETEMENQNQQMLEATRAELLKYGISDSCSDPFTGEETSRKVRQSKSHKKLQNDVQHSTETSATVCTDRESTHSPDLVRSNRGSESEATPNASSGKSAALNSTESYEEGNSSDIWVSMKKLKKLSTH